MRVGSCKSLVFDQVLEGVEIVIIHMFFVLTTIDVDLICGAVHENFKQLIDVLV